MLRRRALFARLNAVDHRRGLFLWRRVRASRLTSMRKTTQAVAATVIVVDVVTPAVNKHDEKPVRPTTAAGTAAIAVAAAIAAAVAAAAAPPAALLARLLARPSVDRLLDQAALHKSRECAAASRRALALTATRTTAARSTERAAAAARKRATRLDYTRLLHAARMAASASHVQKAATVSYAARAERAAKRLRKASAGRAAARGFQLACLDKAGTRQPEA